MLEGLRNTLKELPIKKILIFSSLPFLIILATQAYKAIQDPQYSQRNGVSLTLDSILPFLGVFLFYYAILFSIIISIVNSVKLDIRSESIFKKYYLNSAILSASPAIVGCIVAIFWSSGLMLSYSLFYAFFAALISLIITSIIHTVKKIRS